MDQKSTPNADNAGDATRAESMSPETEVDPKEFLRALLGINAGDAERVRHRSPATRQRSKGKHGPVHDYGEG